MNILHINYSDGVGGASRAAYRIFTSLNDYYKNNNLKTFFRVDTKITDDYRIIGNPQTGKLWRKIHPLINKIPYQSFSSVNKTAHSIAYISNGFHKSVENIINKYEIDLLHLHWIGNNTLTIEEIGRIKVPIIWTLHDQWAFCGAEHYAFPPEGDLEKNSSYRFISGYNKINRDYGEKGLDLDAWTWKRKKKSWKKPMNIVCPSTWLSSCAKKSSLMSSWPISTIPYPINLNKWKPIDSNLARDLLNLPKDNIPIVLFGAIGGTNDPRKGSGLLFDAFLYLKELVKGTHLDNLRVIIFGQSEPEQKPNIGFHYSYLGKISDDIALRLLYSAANLMVVPSIQDNFPQTATESHACGTPVVSFKTGGLTDIIDHKITGYLADPFQSKSLAKGIKYILDSSENGKLLGINARYKAERLWEEKLIASKYKKLYQEIIS